MRANINDIANRAGVSKTTVSFAFNNPSRISKGTRERIMDIARDLGYVPDPAARTLATRSTGSIGLLLPQSIHEVFRNPYIGEIMRGIGVVCDREGLTLALTRDVRSAVVDGIITLGIGPGMSALEVFRRRGLPFVSIDSGAGEDFVNVGIDDEKASEQLMDMVLSAGHREIAVFALKNVTLAESGDHFSLINDRRLRGFSRSLARRGLSFISGDGVRVCHTDVSAESGALATRALLADKNIPTAIICLADVQALGVYTECRAAAFEIPKDISVIGFDDSPFSAFMAPPLTTLRQSGFAKGEKAAQTLVDMIAKRSVSSTVLETEIVMRGSCGQISLN